MLAAVAFAVTRYRKKDRYSIEIIPGIFPLLGLVLTMVGVTIGLYQYDHKNLDSISNLLDGLKLAFVGSILGVAASIGFQVWNRNYAQKKEEKDDSLLVFAQRITSELTRLNTGIDFQNKQLSDNFRFINEANKVIHNEIRDDSRTEKILQAVVEEIGRGNELLRVELQRVAQEVKILNDNQTEHFNALSHIDKILLKQVHLGREEQKENLRSIRDTLERAKNEAEQHHLENKALLEGLGAELQKNNTEALVKVMQSATEEFNRQMSAIVDRLVKENFQELNAAVQNMLQWQVENKASMELLASRYREYINGIEVVHERLEEISSYNAALSGPNGQLAAMVAELKKLLYDEKPLAEVAEKMVVVMRQATQQLEQTNALNDKIKVWSSQFKGLEDTTVRLVKSIEDMRNFESDVWKKYRAEMQEAVNIVVRTQEELRESMKTTVKEWNRTYADNLTGVFQTLDELMSAYIERLEQK